VSQLFIKFIGPAAVARRMLNMNQKVFFLFVTLFCCCLLCNGQTKQYQFSRLDVNDGLSHNMINDFLRDRQGFMWFATLSGLNRFDGYTFKVFRNIPGDTSSVIINDIYRIFEGPDDKIWIYTHAGNCIYDPATETFYRNTDAILNKLSIVPGLITYVKKDSKGRFWFIHYNQGLFRYDPASQTTVRLQTQPADGSSLASNEMSAVEEDAAGNLWIIHKNGIFEMLDPLSLKITYRNSALKLMFNGQVMEYNIVSDSDNDLWIYSNSNYGCFYFNHSTAQLEGINSTSRVQLSSNIVRDIVQDNDGTIWIATDHGGLDLLDKKHGFRIRNLRRDDEDEKSIGQNSINSLYKDPDGMIWIGTYKNGISYYHENIFRFPVIRNSKQDPSSLPFNDINAFAEDKQGNLWIGTNGGGLIYFDRKNKKFTRYVHDPSRSSSISSDVIVSLYLDHQNVLWIGTYYGGLNTFDGSKFTRYKHDPANPRTIGDDSVWEILEDSNHHIWIGTLRGGVDVYDREKGEFFHYRNGDFNSIHTTYVPALREDSEGNMWIGTGYGIDVLEKQSGRFVHYLNDIRNPGTISNNSILSIIEDSRGLVWVGTHGGLNLFDKTKKTFRVFLEKDGLPNNSVLTLVEDNEHNLWMATPNGISKMTVAEKTNGDFDFSFKNYDESDGLQGKAFNENAVLKCSGGELVFGGPNGFNIFRPEEIHVNNISPKVTLTDFQIFNESVGIGEKGNGKTMLHQSVTGIDKITLSHADNVFSLEFAALNFFHPEKSLYQYTMENFNNGWLTTDAKQRKVTFTNLDPGDYIFKVKASNNDGLWNDTPTVVKITVLPPFWKSGIAFGFYALLIIGALLLARWIILTKERLNFRIQQERQEAHRMHELDMMKIKFFTNVSHEFRTPLTLILTPLEKILKQTTDAEQKNQFQLIHRNARRLLNLVNQLLDFRRMEVQEIRLNPSEGDIVKFIRDLVYSFSDLSEKKNIRFSFVSTAEALETLFDQDKIEKILFNLLSNAFKFTPENGSVRVELELKKEQGSSLLVLKVSDTGIGIPADKQDKIFERFFQHAIPSSMVNQGSGIGLSITREFVKIHGGIITVESEEGKGSCFTILLPLQEILHQPVTEAREDHIEIPVAVDHEIIEASMDNRKPVLLLVEDNEDFRFYLKDNLKSHYSIIEAVNGKEAFRKSVGSMPDLIVSDVMMPEMNGIELCKKIRNDPQTCHIPVILLTARTAEEQKLEGFDTGASDYITKPFNFEILQSRIRNLIAQREAFQKVFQKHLDVRASDIQITSLDEKLIGNAIKIVEAHIGDTDFSVEELSREMGMSRVHLYKKLLSLTGKSPIEFIRTIRLQRAAQLLEKSQLTVAEVAYQVGFNNPKYFTKYFKDQFNILPSAYASGKN
jgi:signal transduction histidine kinase/ligand-binding sensor domain-containing protein/DNA-binding response OmpR family regulator